MKAKSTFLSFAMAAMFLLTANTQFYALNYTISFSASGVTSNVGTVQVQNLTKATSVTIPSGNTLTLDVATAINELNANNSDIRFSQNASKGTTILTFYASQTGNTQVAAYAIDGRKVLGQFTHINIGDNSFELSLPASMYIIRVSGTGYAYSAKLQTQSSKVAQTEIKFLNHTKIEVPASQKSNAAATTTMAYTAGDKLLYTATSGVFIASVPDVPTESKTTNFNFATLPTSAIPAGTFNMGSPSTEVGTSSNEIQYSVTLSAFRISKYEISNAQFAAFLNIKKIGSNGMNTAGAYPTQELIYGSASNYDWGLHYNYSNSQWIPVTGYENAPVIYVTWYGAMEYASYIGGTLPTEAQWEYACRAGTTTPFNTGSFLTNLQANYNWAIPYNGGINTVTTKPGKTQNVGTYAPNAYGLYDMHGNVWEWCADWYAIYPTTPQTNPTGPSAVSWRVMRGGAWYYSADVCRSAERDYRNPFYTDGLIGFRVALVP